MPAPHNQAGVTALIRAMDTNIKRAFERAAAARLRALLTGDRRKQKRAARLEAIASRQFQRILQADRAAMLLNDWKPEQ